MDMVVGINLHEQSLSEITVETTYGKVWIVAHFLHPFGILYTYTCTCMHVHVHVCMCAHRETCESLNLTSPVSFGGGGSEEDICPPPLATILPPPVIIYMYIYMCNIPSHPPKNAQKTKDPLGISTDVSHSASPPASSVPCCI